MCLHIFVIKVFSSFIYAFAFYFFGSIIYRFLLVSQSLLFTFQCAFYFLNSICVERDLLYYILEHLSRLFLNFFKVFLFFFSSLFSSKKVQNNKLVLMPFFYSFCPYFTNLFLSFFLSLLGTFNIIPRLIFKVNTFFYFFCTFLLAIFTSSVICNFLKFKNPNNKFTYINNLLFGF